MEDQIKTQLTAMLFTLLAAGENEVTQAKEEQNHPTLNPFYKRELFNKRQHNVAVIKAAAETINQTVKDLLSKLR